MQILSVMFLGLVFLSFPGFAGLPAQSGWHGTMHGLANASPHLGYYNSELSQLAVTGYVNGKEFQEALKNYPGQNRFLLVLNPLYSDNQGTLSFVYVCHHAKHPDDWEIIPIVSSQTLSPLTGAIDDRCSRLAWGRQAEYYFNRVPQIYFSDVKSLALIELYRLVPGGREGAGVGLPGSWGEESKTEALSYGGGRGQNEDDNDPRRKRRGRGFIEEDLYIIGLQPCHGEGFISGLLPPLPHPYSKAVEKTIQQITPPAFVEPDFVLVFFIDNGGNLYKRRYSRDELEELTGISIKPFDGSMSFYSELMPEDASKAEIVKLKAIVQEMMQGLREFNSRPMMAPVSSSDSKDTPKEVIATNKGGSATDNTTTKKQGQDSKNTGGTGDDGEGEAPKNPFFCEQCKETFSTEAAFNAHIKAGHGQANDPGPKHQMSLMARPAPSSGITKDELDAFPDGFQTEIAIIAELAQEQNIDVSCIDEASLKNMALGLKYAGISSIEEAMELKLQVIPPSAAFHTWYARNYTTLSEAATRDGKNLNYVSRISQQATLFKSWGIPLFIVYSKHNLTPEQKQEMESLFSDHDNIVMLSIDDDLSELPLYNYCKNPVVDESWSAYRPNSWDFMDGIRYSVIMDFPWVLDILEAKAITSGKPGFAARLQSLGKQGVMYLDIDNQLLYRPPYFLGRNGKALIVRFGSPYKKNEFRKYLKNKGSTQGYHLPEYDSENHYVKDHHDISEAQLAKLQVQAEALLLDILNYPGEYDVDTLCWDSNFQVINKERAQLFLVPEHRSKRAEEGDYESHRSFSVNERQQLSRVLELKELKLNLIQQVRYLLMGNDRSFW